MVAIAGVWSLLGAWLWRHLGGFQWDNDEGILAAVGRSVADGNELYTRVWFDHPPGLPWILAGLTAAAGNDVEMLRAACLALALVGAIAVALLARRLAGPLAAVVAVPLLILAPNFFWLSRSINPDLPAMGLAMLGVAIAWRRALLARSRGRDSVSADTGFRRAHYAWWFVAGLAVGAGVSIKLTPLVLAPVMALLVLQGAWTASTDAEAANKMPSGRVDFRRLAGAALCLLAGAGVAVSTWLRAAPPGVLLASTFGTLSSARDAYPDRSAEFAQRLLTDNLLAENLGLTLLASWGLLHLWRRRRFDALVATVWLASIALALYAQRPLWPKHHWSLVLWPLATLAAVGLGHALRLVAGRRARLSRLTGAVVIGAWLATVPATSARLAGLVAPDPFSAGIDGVNWVLANTSPGATIVSDNGLIPFVTGRRVPVGLELVSSKRIATGELTDEELIDFTRAQGAEAVLSWDGMLEDFGDYMAWVTVNYRQAARVGEDRSIWARRAIPPATVADGSTFEGVGVLEGFDIRPERVEPGGVVTLTLHWSGAGPTSKPLSVFVHVVDTTGTTVAQADGPPVDGTWPTPFWRPDQAIPDVRRIQIPPDITTGALKVKVGFYDETGSRIPAHAPGGEERWDADAVTLGATVSVVRRGALR